MASADDTTVNPEKNTEHAHDLIPRSLLSLYDNVTRDGHQLAGHWSWVYAAWNDPTLCGTHIWRCMVRHRR